MFSTDDFKSINWFKGLPLFPAHFQWMEHQNRVAIGFVSASSGRHGLIGPPVDDKPPKAELLRAEGIGTQHSRIIVTHCVAIAPNGAILFVEPASKEAPSVEVSHKNAGEVYHFFLHAPCALPWEIEDRTPTEMKVPDAKMNLGLLAPYYRLICVPQSGSSKLPGKPPGRPDGSYKIGEAVFDGKRLTINEFYVPSALRMECHLALKDMANKVGTELDKIYSSTLDLAGQSAHLVCAPLEETSAIERAVGTMSMELSRLLMHQLDRYNTLALNAHPSEWLAAVKSVLRTFTGGFELSGVKPREMSGALAEQCDRIVGDIRGILAKPFDSENQMPVLTEAAQLVQHVASFMIKARETLTFRRPAPVKEEKKKKAVTVHREKALPHVRKPEDGGRKKR